MEWWAHEGACEEDVDSIKAVVEESDETEDDLVKNAICEVPHRSCQVGGHVGEEGTRRCCQHRACVERDQLELRAMSGRLAEEAPERWRNAERRKRGADDVRGCRSGLVEDEVMMLATKSCGRR
jgi:hypothetical protein